MILSWGSIALDLRRDKQSKREWDHREIMRLRSNFWLVECLNGIRWNFWQCKVWNGCRFLNTEIKKYHREFCNFWKMTYHYQFTITKFSAMELSHFLSIIKRNRENDNHFTVFWLTKYTHKFWYDNTLNQMVIYIFYIYTYSILKHFTQSSIFVTQLYFRGKMLSWNRIKLDQADFLFKHSR